MKDKLSIPKSECTLVFQGKSPRMRYGFTMREVIIPSLIRALEAKEGEEVEILVWTKGMDSESPMPRKNCSYEFWLAWFEFRFWRGGLDFVYNWDDWQFLMEWNRKNGWLE